MIADEKEEATMNHQTTHPIGRRDFIKSALAAGTGILAGPAILQGGESPNEKLNIGMVGIGNKGETNFIQINGFKQNIIALCDVDDTLGALARRMAPKANQYRDFREMLDKEKSLDAVVVTVPDHSHAVISVAAMRLGKHVYVEKPMAHSIWEVREMSRIAREMKVMTQMGNHGHAGWNLRRAVELVQAGAIGKVREFHAWTDRPHWPCAMDRPADSPPVPPTLKWDIWLGPASERPYNPAYLPKVWRGWRDFGTGALGDMACHIADLGFWALKLQYPVSVEAEVSDKHEETYPKWSIIKYDFPQRGDLPPVTMTWYDGGKRPDPALIEGEEMADNGSLLIGDEGKLYVPDTYGAKYTLLPKAKFADYKGPESKMPISPGHHKEWVEACKGGPPALSNFDNAGPLTEVVLLGNIALVAGKKIEWDGLNMKALNWPEAERIVKPTFRNGWTL